MDGDLPISPGGRLWLGTKSWHDCQHGGNNENRKLRELKWRLGLRRSHRVQRRDFFEGLHDQNEQIEIETDHRADRVDPAPCSREMLGTARKNRDREKWERDNSEADGGRKSVEW